MFRKKKKSDVELSPTDRILRNLMRTDGPILDGTFINDDDPNFNREGHFIDGIEQDADDL